MAWSLLPTDYTDAVWSGLKRYTQIDNSDGTVSFNDVTTYTNKEKSFFGAKDANRMNQALNYIMSMLENGTDLYAEFQTYFVTQQTLFRNSANDVIENVRTLTNAEYDSYKTYVANLKKEGDSTLAGIEQTYEEHMTSYESEQKAAFDAWFAAIQNSLSEDVAGSLQNQLTEVEERLSALEYMTLQNDFTAPIVVDSEGTILTDDLGYAIVADWKYKED
jgi:hypothetical protein